jgi:hypothetical protein
MDIKTEYYDPACARLAEKSIYDHYNKDWAALETMDYQTVAKLAAQIHKTIDKYLEKLDSRP